LTIDELCKGELAMCEEKIDYNYGYNCIALYAKDVLENIEKGNIDELLLEEFEYLGFFPVNFLKEVIYYVAEYTGNQKIEGSTLPDTSSKKEPIDYYNQLRLACASVGLPKIHRTEAWRKKLIKKCEALITALENISEKRIERNEVLLALEFWKQIFEKTGGFDPQKR
jgi:hypothetical protein